MAQRNPGLVEGNRFKLGIFGPNCSGGLAFTKLPERWDADWDKNVVLAQMADQAGIECLIPVGRWKGYGGATDVNGTSFETITWAGGLLPQTRRINIFGTVHAPLFNPVMAAKMMVTVDHAGHGRFGINIVCGWNQGEFEMFGAVQQEHDGRYEQGQEWWEVVRLLWSGQGPVDYHGRFFNLKGLVASPRPWGERAPLMMNAGASPAGRAFAIRNSDLHFDACGQPEQCVERIAETKRLALQNGHAIAVWTPISVICRPTQREAEEYVERVVEHADWEALDHLLGGLTAKTGGRSRPDDDLLSWRRNQNVRAILGYGGEYSVQGDPDHVARELARLHGVGFDGVAISFIDYIPELAYFAQEVLPRLERMGLRKPPPVS
ncbi:MAG TPA: LLM class flavin-dependent oxidoreductase [Candidatus Binataceae bacterium]|nr:LLM class flavin-dependent oxidoreductase [Candidatus Binataceae bacterium]